jgi:crotonobetaine/carnitine-CoA ligase
MAPGQAPDFADLFAHYDRSMPHFMVPRYYRAVDEIPATPTGKPRKGDLRSGGRSGAWDALAAGFKPTRRS